MDLTGRYSVGDVSVRVPQFVEWVSLISWIWSSQGSCTCSSRTTTLLSASKRVNEEKLTWLRWRYAREMHHQDELQQGECPWQEVSRQLQKMQDEGIIQPSNSPWASPIVMVREMDPIVFVSTTSN